MRKEEYEYAFFEASFASLLMMPIASHWNALAKAKQAVILQARSTEMYKHNSLVASRWQGVEVMLCQHFGGLTGNSHPTEAWEEQLCVGETNCLQHKTQNWNCRRLNASMSVQQQSGIPKAWALFLSLSTCCFQSDCDGASCATRTF